MLPRGGSITSQERKKLLNSKRTVRTGGEEEAETYRKKDGKGEKERRGRGEEENSTKDSRNSGVKYYRVHTERRPIAHPSGVLPGSPKASKLALPSDPARWTQSNPETEIEATGDEKDQQLCAERQPDSPNLAQ